MRKLFEIRERNGKLLLYAPESKTDISPDQDFWKTLREGLEELLQEREFFFEPGAEEEIKEKLEIIRKFLKRG